MRRFRLRRRGGKNERSLARAEQLQLLADLELLLGGVGLELLDAVPAVVVFALDRGVLLFHFADLIPLLAQGRDPLGTSQRPVSERADQDDDTPENDAAYGI